MRIRNEWVRNDERIASRRVTFDTFCVRGGWMGGSIHIAIFAELSQPGHDTDAIQPLRLKFEQTR